MTISTDQLVLQRIFTRMAEFHASDLHISVGTLPTLRVNGRLIPLEKETMVTPEFIEQILATMLSPQDKKELEEKREIFFAHEFFEKARFRIHVFFQQGIPALSLRMMAARIPLMNELDLPSIFSFAAEPKEGVCILGGTYGSGRTTALASIINTINNTQNFRIMTLERPIEYIFLDNKSIVEQREVGKDTPSFLTGLNSALNEDIDVLMVGEMENEEVIDAVLELAESKKAIYVTVNGATVADILEKISRGKNNAESERRRERWAQVLVEIIVQKLIPGVGEVQKLAVEYIIPDEAVRNMIVSGKWSQVQDSIRNSGTDAAQSFDRSLGELVRQRKISLEKALENAYDRGKVQNMFQNINE